MVNGLSLLRNNLILILVVDMLLVPIMKIYTGGGDISLKRNNIEIAMTCVKGRRVIPM